MLLYALSRFVIEFFRGDPRGMVFGFSTSQFISMVLGPLSLMMLVYLARTSPPVPESAMRRSRAAA
jgi:prolipoprotein diacylglyceryltransferase